MGKAGVICHDAHAGIGAVKPILLRQKVLNIPPEGGGLGQSLQAGQQFLRSAGGAALQNVVDIIGHVSSSTTLNIYAHVTDEMQRTAAAKIDLGIGKKTPTAEAENTPRKPAPSTFQPYKGQRRKPGTGCISQINDHLWEGRYSPVVNGRRMARNIYAKTEAECEKKLAELIRQMKSEIAAEKAG